MNTNYSTKTKDLYARIWRLVSPIAGLPLLYIGAAILALHFFLNMESNAVMVLALTLEIVGIICHCLRIRHQ